MKRLIGIVSLLALMVSCDRIEGELQLSQEILLKNSRGVTRTIAPNTYQADIRLQSQKQITLRLGSNDQYIFNVPRKIPANGDFAFSSVQVGQPVDLTGTVRTIITRSETYQDWEMCSYTEWRTFCQPGPNGSRVCQNIPYTRQGREYVRFYIETTDRDVTLQIRPAGNSEIAGDFSGDASYRQRVYIERWPCR
jgi:hypothetical protein